MRLLLLLLVAASAVGRSDASANLGGVPGKRLKMQYATGPLLKFQICDLAAAAVEAESLASLCTGYRRVFEEYMRVISQRYPDIRIEGENYLPQPIYRHIASFLSVFKLVLIGLIIVGKDPFAFFGMQAPSIWQWGQENKVYACMMVFFLSNMIENQCMSTGAFEITLNDVPVWSKLESGHLPSMQQLVQILDNEMKLNVHMDSIPHHRS
ncbi:hypothetical protein FD755_014207 [Muntiacus reevesi]|uniref:Selenoprotein T n=1 Tax=Muntiacus reevesi TaxID=9886 RepID=A0A5N3XJ64_MUNRE|nr:hypothetical protein FD755_014207 [Muntiacus reevesi]